MVCHTELDVGAAAVANNPVLNPMTIAAYGPLAACWNTTPLASSKQSHATSHEPLSRILILKLAAKLHRFPLLGLQTIAAIYRQSRSTDVNNECLSFSSISGSSRANAFNNSNRNVVVNNDLLLR